jgi:hypothetical protein
MACGNTYTHEQAKLASRSRKTLQHPNATAELSEDRKKVILDAVGAKGFESAGQRGLPRLHIFTNDKITIDTNGDILVWRPELAGWVPKVGVAFAHSLKSGNYKGFSIAKVESVKHKILIGELTAFHFVTSESFPADIQRVIEVANDELRKKGMQNDHLINFHRDKQYPFPLPRS